MIPVAIQLYTLREETDKNMKDVLMKVKEIGYQGVELAGYGNLTVEMLKEILDRLELDVVANHVPLTDLINRLDDVIKEQIILGNTRVVCPFLLREDRHDAFYKDLPVVLSSIKETLSAHGMTLHYHHHDFELLPYGKNDTVLSYLLDQVPDLKLELDVYWLNKAGGKLSAWADKYHDRIKLVHLKDMTNDQAETFAPLGTGKICFDDVLKTLSPDYWIVEQDETNGDPFKAITTSYQFLKNKGVI